MQGVKLGDMQATVQGFLSTGLFFVISNSTPLPTLSAQRPHPTIFSLYVFLSVLGQAAVHLALLVSFYFGALRLMPQVCQACWNLLEPFTVSVKHECSTIVNGSMTRFVHARVICVTLT